MSGEKAHHIYETYKNTVMPHGYHTYAKAYDIAKATICTYPHSDHALSHWKCVLRCCSDCPFILHFVHCCQLNQNKCPHDTRSCVVVNVAFLLKVYIRHFYPGVIGI